MTDDFVIFAGTANAELAASVARELGVSLGACAVERFPDGETSVRLDEPVRGREVFVVQPTQPPVNDHLVELAGLRGRLPPRFSRAHYCHCPLLRLRALGQAE